MTGKSKSDGVEDLMEENFFVDPATIASRKTSTMGDGMGRIRDHKLQVLYRIEIHWLLPNQEKQRGLESQILAHLRQISIWKGQDEMIHFLQEVLTPSYVECQPEMLCLLFEELGLSKPDSLSSLISPAKSIAPPR